MKNKLVSLLTTLGLLLTNAAIAGNSTNIGGKIGYSSDFFYRGVQKSEEALQSSINASAAFSSVVLHAHACANNAVENGTDSYHMGAGVSKSFIDDLLSVYTGINHFEDIDGASLSEVELNLGLNILLNPKVSIFRDFDDSLYTYEFGVAHSFDLDFVSLNLDASVGDTDLANGTDRTYYSVGSAVVKSINDHTDLSVSVDYVDADDIDREYVFGGSISFNF
jgi:hypothetical protein